MRPPRHERAAEPRERPPRYRRRRSGSSGRGRRRSSPPAGPSSSRPRCGTRRARGRALRTLARGRDHALRRRRCTSTCPCGPPARRPAASDRTMPQPTSSTRLAGADRGQPPPMRSDIGQVNDWSIGFPAPPAAGHRLPLVAQPCPSPSCQLPGMNRGSRCPPSSRRPPPASFP